MKQYDNRGEHMLAIVTLLWKLGVIKLRALHVFQSYAQFKHRSTAAAFMEHVRRGL